MRHDSPVAVELGHAEVAEVLGVGLAGEHDAGPVLLRREVLDDRADRALEHVVGEHHHARVAVDEPLGEPERLGDAAGPLLVAVEELVDAVLLAVAEQAEELAGVRAAVTSISSVTPAPTSASIAYVTIGRS